MQPLLIVNTPTMELQKMLTADYLDILYNNRNKAYGSYELRRNYDRRLLYALGIMLSTAIVLSANALYNRAAPVSVQANPFVMKEYNTSDFVFEQPKPLPKPKMIEAVEPPKPKATIANTPPVIVKDHDVVKPVKANLELIDKEPGDKDSDGDAGGIASTNKPGTRTDVKTDIITLPALTPIFIAEEMPAFNGNINQYLAKNISYPARAREESIAGKVTVQFVVNEDGSVSNVKVLKGIGGGCDEEAVRVVSNMPKWKPGKHNGKNVKVYYTLPIRFILE